MNKAKLAQYATAAGLVIAALLSDDQVLAALGLWLSPSLITLVAAVAGAAARRAVVPVPKEINPDDETTEPYEILE